MLSTILIIILILLFFTTSLRLATLEPKPAI